MGAESNMAMMTSPLKKIKQNLNFINAFFEDKLEPP